MTFKLSNSKGIKDAEIMYKPTCNKPDTKKKEIVAFELQKIEPHTRFAFRSVLKRRRKDGDFSLITFAGLPDEYSEWVSSQRLREIIENGNPAVFQPLLKFTETS